jgi:hypothetical protein
VFLPDYHKTESPAIHTRRSDRELIRIVFCATRILVEGKATESIRGMQMKDCLSLVVASCDHIGRIARRRHAEACGDGRISGGVSDYEAVVIVITTSMMIFENEVNIPSFAEIVRRGLVVASNSAHACRHPDRCTKFRFKEGGCLHNKKWWWDSDMFAIMSELEQPEPGHTQPFGKKPMVGTHTKATASLLRADMRSVPCTTPQDMLSTLLETVSATSAGARIKCTGECKGHWKNAHKWIAHVLPIADTTDPTRWGIA